MSDLKELFQGMNPNRTRAYFDEAFAIIGDKLNVYVETAKINSALEKNLFDAIKTYDRLARESEPNRRIGSCVFLQGDDLLITFPTRIFFIEDVKEEIEELVKKEHLSGGWDEKFKYEEDEIEATEKLVKEQLPNFDFIDFAVDNLHRWEEQED